MIRDYWNDLLRIFYIEEDVEMCEMYIDHDPIWDGCGFTCAVCGLEFTSKGSYMLSEQVLHNLIGEDAGDRPTDWKGDNDPQWWDECSIGYNQAKAEIRKRIDLLNNK